MEGAFEDREGSATLKAERRSFLGAALATVTVAAVTGGTAALLLEADSPPQVVVKDSLANSPTPATSAPDVDASYLQARLTALETENNDLQNSLSAARRQLASYSEARAGKEAGEDWQGRYEQANAQATQLADQLDAVRGLLTLYEELEAVGLATTIASGVAAVGGALGGLMADVPAVTEGLAAGRKALDEFEEQLPLLEQGRYWLEGQMLIVGAALDATEAALSSALKAGGSFMQLLNRWFEDILKWLPFGIGEGALAVMSTLNDLLDKLPETLNGLQDNVARPLDVWLERDGDENRLQRRLIKPVRVEAFDRADSTVMRLGSVHDVYEVQLRAPVATLLERQRLLSEKIIRYRQDHAL